MTTFADSSALVKLYADEPGQAEIRDLSVVVVSELARVEVPAAIWRKHRTGELAAQEAGLLTSEFEADWYGTAASPSRFLVAVVNDQVLDTAARLAGAHGLRAYDAVQLATAAAVRAAEPSCQSFAASDESLRRAATLEGFAIVP